MNNIEKVAVFIIGILVGIACCGSYMAHTYIINTEPVKRPERVIIVKEVEVPVEVIKEVEVEVPVYIPYEEPFYRNFTAEDEYYLKDGAMREGEGEGVIGQAHIMYVIINRAEAFGMSIKEVVLSDAFAPSLNRAGKIPNDDCNEAFALIQEGWTPKPLYFRAGQYHDFGTPLYNYGGHWFSC